MMVVVHHKILFDMNKYQKLYISSQSIRLEDSPKQQFIELNQNVAKIDETNDVGRRTNQYEADYDERRKCSIMR